MADIKKELLAPCGLYCGVCRVYIAHRDDNQKFIVMKKGEIYDANIRR